MPEIYRQGGDFAVATLLATQYALAAMSQTGDQSDERTQSLRETASPAPTPRVSFSETVLPQARTESPPAISTKRSPRCWSSAATAMPSGRAADAYPQLPQWRDQRGARMPVRLVVNQSSPINHEERITTMQRTMKYAAVSIAVSLGITLAGCSKADKAATAESKTSSSTSTSATTSTKSSSTSKTQAPKSARPTIQDYIAQNSIPKPRSGAVIQARQSTYRCPTVGRRPDKFADTATLWCDRVHRDRRPRRIHADPRRLVEVDRQRRPIGVLRTSLPANSTTFPDSTGRVEGDRTSLSGFEAVQLGGPYDTDGKQGMIAQKTVVIPGQDGLYVLQLNAYSAVGGQYPHHRNRSRR